MGLDDEGQAFEPSPDPLLEKLRQPFAGLKLGQVQDVHGLLSDILSDETIWGSDLYAAGVAPKAEKYFAEMSAGVHGVRETLARCLK